jgi:hypothetical protein
VRRTIAFIGIPALFLLSVATATTASAVVVNGGTLTSGTPVTATIGTANQDIQYSFAGTNGVHATVDVTATNWGAGTARLYVYTPGGPLFTSCALAAAPTFCEFTPNATGTWKLTLDPVGTAVGSAKFTFANDLNKGALTAGAATTTALPWKGQNASYTYAATAGRPVTLNVTASSWGSGSARLYFYRPTGTALFSFCNLGNAPTTCSLYPDTTGNWRITLDPLSSAVGSTTFTAVSDLDLGPLTADTPVATTISVPGQNARYSVAGTDGEHLDLHVTDSDWGTGGADLYVFDPAGSLYVSCPVATGHTFCDFTPNETGSWKVMLDPTATSTGKATLTLVKDLAKGPLTAGTAVATTIDVPGRNAGFTFAGTADEHSTIDVKAASWGAGNTARVYLYQPDGTLFTYCEMASAPTFCEFTPDVTGTWTAVLDPQEDAVGNATLLFATDQHKGALVPGTLVTTTISARGQNADFTFAGVKSTPVTFTVPATNWGAGGAARLYVFSPDGSLYDWCNLGSTPTSCTTYPDRTGTFKLVLDPLEDAVGSAGLKRS